VSQSFNALEKRSVAALASVYGLRMYGLFLLLPVLVIHAEQLQGATPMLMGIALGVYGMTQAIFQLPFGFLSDKYGRKEMITVGLLLFVIGSLIAAASSTIEGVILGRAVQGMGAIAAVVLALTSDLTRESQRSKAMAIIGMSIGAAFLLALMSAPILEFWIGVRGLFIMTAVFAVLALILIWRVVPTPVPTRNMDVRPVPAQMWSLLKDQSLLKLDIGIFLLHFTLTASFVIVPIVLLEGLDLDTSEHWKIYLPALLGSIPFMALMVITASSPTRNKWVFFASICLLVLAQVLLVIRPVNSLLVTVALFFFFWGFNTLEALLPSLVSRLAPAAGKGSAMGVYNTFQFTGVFFGGFFGGLLYGQFGVTATFVLLGLVLVWWAWFAYKSDPFRLLDSLTVKINPAIRDVCREAFRDIEGVEEVIVFKGESVAYLKVDKSRLDTAALDALTSS